MMWSAIAFSTVLSASAMGDVKLTRVELLSEDPGTWLHYELPMANTRPGTAFLRLLEQVQPVWESPWENVVFGTSLTVQTIQFERPLGALPVQWSAGVQTALLCPKGVVGAVHWQWRRLHLSAGVSVDSNASWQHRDWSQWTLLPTAGFGILR